MTDPEKHHVTLHWRMPALIALGAALALGGLFTALAMLVGALDVSRAVKLMLPLWLVWVIAAPLVVVLVFRFPLERGRVTLRLIMHIATCVAVVVASQWMKQFFPPETSIAPPPWATQSTAESENSARSMARRGPPNGAPPAVRAALNVLLYSVIFSTGQALVWSRRARERERRALTAEARLAQARLAAIQRDPPDLLFLDIQMPEMDGFELLEKIPREHLPLVIFTTAYDHHAVRAFETHALDYLLKPFKPARFKAAVARARAHLADRDSTTTARGLIDLLAARQIGTPPLAAHYLTRITVKTGEKVLVVKTADIDSIESAGNYVAVNIGKECHILRETLSALESQLNPEHFLRVSRSAVVALHHIKELKSMCKGEST